MGFEEKMIATVQVVAEMEAIGFGLDRDAFMSLMFQCFRPFFIWAKSGKKIEVNVSPGCLLLQTGKQFEWLTGGACMAGMHEVVVSKKTMNAISSAIRDERCLWRASSTVFGHIASDAIPRRLGHFANEQNEDEYPPICSGDYLESELAISSSSKRTDFLINSKLASRVRCVHGL